MRWPLASGFSGYGRLCVQNEQLIGHKPNRVLAYMNGLDRMTGAKMGAKAMRHNGERI